MTVASIPLTSQPGGSLRSRRLLALVRAAAAAGEQRDGRDCGELQQHVYAPGGASPSARSGSSAAASAAPSRMSCSVTVSASSPKCRSAWRTTIAPPRITGARSGSSPGSSRRSAVVSDASRSTIAFDGRAGEAVALDLAAVVAPELERGERRDGARDRDEARHLEPGQQPVDVGGARLDLLARRRVVVQEALGQPDGADVDREPQLVPDELGGAAADVHHDRAVGGSATPRSVSSASSSPESRRVVKP